MGNTNNNCGGCCNSREIIPYNIETKNDKYSIEITIKIIKVVANDMINKDEKWPVKVCWKINQSSWKTMTETKSSMLKVHFLQHIHEAHFN